MALNYESKIANGKLIVFAIKRADGMNKSKAGEIN
jgi:hypothetical protein